MEIRLYDVEKFIEALAENEKRKQNRLDRFTIVLAGQVITFLILFFKEMIFK